MTDKFEIPSDWAWDAEFECFIGSDNKAYTKEGNILRGFADPRQKSKINTKGRPKQSRNKNKLVEAQLKIDEYSVDSVDTLISISKNEWEKLGFKNPIPVVSVLKAATILLDKAISQQKEKDEVVASEEKEDNDVEETPVEEKEDSIGDVVSFSAKK